MGSRLIDTTVYFYSSESENQDLRWAILGAGQFSSIVTEVVLRTYAVSLVRHNKERQIGVIFFPTHRAVEICQILQSVVEAKDGYTSSGHFMAMKDPEIGHGRIVALQYFGSAPELRKIFKPFTDMALLHHEQGQFTFEQHGDHLS